MDKAMHAIILKHVKIYGGIFCTGWGIATILTNLDVFSQIFGGAVVAITGIYLLFK